VKIPAYEVIVGESLPDLGLFIRVDGVLLAGLSTGHTFSLVVRDPTDTSTLFTKTTGFTGQTGTGAPPDGTPNLVCQWATSGQLSTLTAGKDHKAALAITRSSDSRVRKYRFTIRAIDDPSS
jgi:hypothetical protein